MSLVDYATSSDEDEPHSPPPLQVVEDEERQRFEVQLPSSSPEQNPTPDLQIHAPARHRRNLTNPKQVERVPNQPSELELPDASTLFGSPAAPSNLLNARDRSSRVAVAVAESTARKRKLNGSSANYPRNSKVPKGTVPHTKNVPDTGGGKLLPLQLAGRSNVVTEDINKLFLDGKKLPRWSRRANEASEIGEGSGSQHQRSHGISPSVRSKNHAEMQRRCQAAVEEADQPMYDAYVNVDDYREETFSDEEPERESVRPGRYVSPTAENGRFVSSGSLSGSWRRSRKDVDMSWIVTGPVEGGPTNGKVIPSFLGHVASRIWHGQMRGLLKTHNRVTVCNKLRQWYDRMSHYTRRLLDGTGLMHLQHTMFRHIDAPLVCAFIERWQPDTNTFHMPFGEMTIMLHDVWHILRVPIEGRMIDADPDIDQMQFDCSEILGVTIEDINLQYWKKGSIETDTVEEKCSRDKETEAIGWMWLLLGATLFVDKSGTRVRPAILAELRGGLEEVDQYSYGSATLAYLYRHLGVASRGDSQGVAGCLTLLQAWIYEHFPCFRPSRDRVPEENMPRAMTWNARPGGRSVERLQSLRARIDQLTAFQVTWLPYGPDPATALQRTILSGWIGYRDIIEPYCPNRVVRQLGYIQTIPRPISKPAKAHRPWNGKLYKVVISQELAYTCWDTFPQGFMLPLDMYSPATEDPADTVPGYIEWYTVHSHPRLLNVQYPPSVQHHPHSDVEYWYRRCMTLCQRALRVWGDPDEYQDCMEEMRQIEMEWRLAN